MEWMSEISRSAKTIMYVKTNLNCVFLHFLEVGSEKFFDRHVGKLKMRKWNRFDTDYKNE